MAKGLKLDVEGATFWFKDSKSERMGMSKIKDDLDALAMAMPVDESRVSNLYVKETKVNVTSSSDAVLRKASNDGGGLGQGDVALEEAVEENVE